MMKKICSMLLALTMACTMGLTGMAETVGSESAESVVSVTEYGALKTSGDFKYKVLSNGTIEIKSYTGTDEEITIPSKIGKKKVTAICTGDSESLLTDADSVKTVTIPKTVKKIGDKAFWSMTGSLAAIEVDEDNAKFSSVDGVLYSKDVTELIFCPRNKKSVSIPKTVKKIGDSSFSSSLVSSVTIPGSVTEIGQLAFDDCLNLKKIRIPKSVTTIGIEAMGYSWSTESGVTGITIECYSGTAGEEYAKNQEMCYTKFYFNYLVIDKKPSTPKIKKASSSKTTVRLYFSNVVGISGFKVQQYDTSKKKWVKVGVSKVDYYASNTGYNYKIKGLKSGTKYKYRVQAYTTVSSKKTLKSGWSKAFSVTTKS